MFWECGQTQTNQTESKFIQINGQMNDALGALEAYKIKLHHLKTNECVCVDINSKLGEEYRKNPFPDGVALCKRALIHASTAQTHNVN